MLLCIRPGLLLTYFIGKARVDKCGVCSGGNTGKKANAAADECGVCGGDGSSCKGCDGVPASGKKVNKPCFVF